MQDSMSDVKEWLVANGLEEYEALFRQQKIDMDILSSINEGDLKELSIPLGDRKKILRAISTHLRWSSTEPLYTDTPQKLEDSERRLLVVLFCDLVGSTRYATNLDPEDLASLFNTYRSTVRSIIEKHHGLTLIYEGDGIKAYFGSKIASEDEQEQTLNAALQILDAVSHLNIEHAENLEVRIGISTGTVIIGDFDSPTGPNAFGQPMHLAARLEALAEPGTILVDQATFESMKPIFEFTEYGEHEIKGYAEKVPVWRVQGKKQVDSRFAKRYRNTPMVGRQSEIELMTNCWHKTREQRKLSSVVITGEAGIGKSRLAHELLQQVKQEQSKSLLLQCSPYHSDSVYYPLLETISTEIALSDKASPQEKCNRLKSFLSASQVPEEQSFPIFANLFALAEPDINIESDLSESLQEGISKQVFTSHLLGLCENGPLCILVEDIQWIDATTQAFLEHLTNQGEDYPVMIVLTSREPVPADSDTLKQHHFELQRLTPSESQSLMSELFSNKEIPAEFQSFIERKAEGVPLYIEELSSTILDTGLGTKESEAVGREDDNINMTGILQSSLLSKLDRLGESKEIALLAATIGREFDTEILARISPISTSKLKTSLNQLTDAGIIFKSNNSDDSRYYFKHALIQDTARNLLSRKRKESAHRKIADVLVQGTRKLSKASPELVAFHFFKGHDYLSASEYWYTAGRKTARTWAKKEALQMLQRGMEALYKTPDSISRLKSELNFQLEIGDVIYATYGYITERGEQAYQRALELCEQLEDHDASVRALDGLFGMHFNTCHFDSTIEISDRLIQLGNKHDNISALVLGMQFKGMSLFCKGEFVVADDLLTQALTHINRSDEIGSDFPSMAQIYLSWTRYIRNFPEEAIDSYSQAWSIVQVQAPYRKAACLGDGCILYAFMGDAEKVDELVKELIPLVQRYGFNLWLNIAQFFQGWSAAQKGDPEGLEEMEKMMESLGGQEIDKTLYLGLLAETYIKFEEYGKAANTVAAGLYQVKKTGERYNEAELLRINASLIRRTDGDPREYRSLLDKAIACATRQSADSWIERAEKELGRQP
jgi:class 3 adenylate cyclase/tetratricopeptide (TPR) repeat protein/ABC-type transport system involved in cytochrome c biogenesis ATPase subunit